MAGELNQGEAAAVTNSDAPSYVITVKRTKSQTDPPIPVFEAEVLHNSRIWKDSLGSVELLQAYLQGLTAVLALSGLPAHLDWGIPKTRSEPSGIRWTINDRGLVRQNLRADGSVIEY